MMNGIVEIVLDFILIVGAFCTLVGCFGLIRFPDVYNRIHAQTVAIMSGCILSLLGLCLYTGLSVYTLKAITIAAFLFLTNPISSHAIARAAHKSGVKLWAKSVVDKLEEDKV
ncbi:MAG: monovalent cation/H(+) antiporter subunit G [Candidatus Hadarchaeum sp.]|nr:monovalent cation/H(+) antiporter subunit G [Candidatus Hadarchaeum sp.]